MRTDGQWIKDEHGRTLILRGVNLAGSTKVPAHPDGATHLGGGEGGLPPSLRDHRSVSFVGRPFPLAEADEHFARLRAYGFGLLRFLVTWEAIEHAGPGQYDREYLDYLRAVLEKAAAHGLLAFIDPHQDVYSRLTGGDGAPGWTVEAAGFVPERLHPTGAAFLHALHPGRLPPMIWPTNYYKLATATLFTLFFGGDDFAPDCRIDGEPAQQYLQRHYFAALGEVARALRGLDNVIGYGSMNEPSGGFIGIADLTSVPPGMIRKGPSPSPLQAMLAGAGHPQEVDVWEMSATYVGVTGQARLNPQGLSVWRPGYADIWRQAGVWTDADGPPRLVRPRHFAERRGQPVEFARDYLKPFLLRAARELRAVAPAALLFFEGEPVGPAPPWGAGDPPGAVHAAHWYDGMTLMAKSYKPDFTVDVVNMLPVFGVDEVRAAYQRQLAQLKARLPAVPMLLGEFGLPFDLDGGRAYTDGDFRLHTQALDGYYAALDANLLGGTIWNYTPDNRNAYGDGWNGEDLSIYSPDQRRDPGDVYSGGRGLPAIVRPYARATAGEPLHMEFDLPSRTFRYRFRPDAAVQAPTEIFVPRYHYERGFVAEVSAGSYTWDEAAQLLFWQHGSAGAEHALTIRPR
jgi:hypothetical protein